jgi:hypothetical protein
MFWSIVGRSSLIRARTIKLESTDIEDARAASSIALESSCSYLVQDKILENSKFDLFAVSYQI